MQRMLTTLAIMTAMVGCASTPDVREEKMDAIETHADSHVDAVEDRENVTADHIEQTGEVVDEENDFTEARNLYVSEVEARLNKVSVRMEEAKAKAEVGGSPIATDFKDEMATAKTEYELAERHLQQLAAVADDAWETEKDKMDQQLAALEERVNDLVDRAPSA